jgi:hypothetical protein
MASPGWTAPQPASPTPAQFDIVGFILCTIAAIWIAVVVIVMQVAAWFYSQTQLIDGVPVPGWLWLVIAAVQALFTGAPRAHGSGRLPLGCYSAWPGSAQ